MLKLLEEPPKTAIFIFCTTNPERIPKTILSRVQRFDFTKISQDGIVKRLKYIIEQENKEYITYREQNEDALPFGYDCNEIEYEEDALNFIAKTAEGGMRDSITMLEKCLGYSKKLTVENVVKALGISDYESLYQLLINIQTKELNYMLENYMNNIENMLSSILFTGFKVILIILTISIIFSLIMLAIGCLIKSQKIKSKFLIAVPSLLIGTALFLALPFRLYLF